MAHQLLEGRPIRRAVSEQPEPEVLIDEVRRRARRRRLLTTSVVVLLVGLGGGTYAFSHRSSSAPSERSTRANGAGSGAASVSKVTPEQPVSLAVSRDGDLYIGDRGRNEVLEWVPSGTFWTVAGTGVAGLTGDGGPADRAEVNAPGSLVIAPNGTLYFAQNGPYLGPASSSGGMLSTVIREVTPSGTIRTVAGLNPSCQPGPARAVPAESALFYGASLSLGQDGDLAVGANLCVGNMQDEGFGPNLLLTSSGRFVRDASDPVPAVASVNCGSGVPGPGFQVFGCASGGGEAADGHGPELLVVRSSGSSVGYPDSEGLDFAVGDGEVVATYNGNLVRVTNNRLVPVLTNQEILSALHIQAGMDIGGLTVNTNGDIYFVASIISRSGCQNRVLERTSRGTLRQIWGSLINLERQHLLLRVGRTTSDRPELRRRLCTTPAGAEPRLCR